METDLGPCFCSLATKYASDCIKVFSRLQNVIIQRRTPKQENLYFSLNVASSVD